MKRFLTIFIFSGVLMGNVYANETHSIKVHVEGMVCAFCAQGIEKRISNIPGVLSVEVDLKTKVVSVQTSTSTTIADREITAAIKEAGYNVQKIQRPNAITPARPVPPATVPEQP